MKNRCISLVLTCAIILCSFGSFQAMAAAPDSGSGITSENSVVPLRASNSFNFKVAAGKIIASDTALSLGAGDTVEVNAVYTPAVDNIDVGLVDSDGLFYSRSVSGGKIDVSFNINTRGKYRLAFRNNSSSEITVTGFVDY